MVNTHAVGRSMEATVMVVRQVLVVPGRIDPGSAVEVHKRTSVVNYASSV